MEIVHINEVKPGDVILIDGYSERTCEVVTVDSVDDGQLIIPREMGGIDYLPDDLSTIVRLSDASDPSTLRVRAAGVVIADQRQSKEAHGRLSDALQTLRQQALDVLRSAECVLADTDAADFAMDDDFFELPTYFKVDKHEFFIEYAVVSVKGGHFKGYATGEIGSAVELPLDQLSDTALIDLADRVKDALSVVGK